MHRIMIMPIIIGTAMKKLIFRKKNRRGIPTNKTNKMRAMVPHPVEKSFPNSLFRFLCFINFFLS
jgi:hypothetical protein